MDKLQYDKLEWFISDVAYISNSTPKYILLTSTKTTTQSNCTSSINSYVNMLQSFPNIDSMTHNDLIDIYSKTISNIKDHNISNNDLLNIALHAKPIKNDPNKNLLIQNLEVLLNTTFISTNISTSITSFQKDYKTKFQTKSTFRQLEPIQSTEFEEQSSNISFEFKNTTLNDIFNSIELTNIFPICKYYTFIKLHSSIDNYKVLNEDFTTSIHEFESTNNNKIILFYLLKKSKPNDIKSYIPIIIEKQQKSIIMDFDITKQIWSDIQSDFTDIFTNIKPTEKGITSISGKFYYPNTHFNKAILSHVCMLYTSDFILKNEFSSYTIRKSFHLHLTHDTNIDIFLLNNNIIGNETSKHLTKLPSKTKYIEVTFKKVKNKDHVCIIKKNVGKLLKLYSNLKNDIEILYKSVSPSFNESDDISNFEPVSSKKVTNFITSNIKTNEKFPYTSKCQKGRSPLMTNSPPELRNDPNSPYVQLDSNNIRYMKWPKDSDNHNWFYCTSDNNTKSNNKQYLYISVLDSKNYNAPCCFMDPTSNIDILNEYFEGQTSESTLKLNTESIKINLSLLYIHINEIPVNFSSLNKIKFNNKKLPKITKDILQLDSQSNQHNNIPNSIEHVNLSIEHILQRNIICFDELGNLIKPHSNPLVGNIYWNKVYPETTILLRNNKKYAIIQPINPINITKLLEIRNNTYINGNKIDPYIFPQTLNWIDSQYIDKAGKCRIIKIKQNENFIYAKTMLPPFPSEIKNDNTLLNSDTLIQKSNIDLILSFINNHSQNILSVSQHIYNNKCVEIKIIYQNYELVFNTLSFPLDYSTYSQKSIIFSNNNKFNTFSKLKDISYKLKKLYINNNNFELNNILQTNNISESQQTIVKSKLKYFYDLYKTRKSNKTYVENMYNINDFTSYPNQRIVYISSYILPTLSNIKIYNPSQITYYHSEPYFLLFNNNIFIAQETKSIHNALYISSNWLTQGFNYRKDDSILNSNSYTIYDENENVLTKKGKGLHQIIVSTLPKYITLLPIHEDKKKYITQPLNITEEEEDNIKKKDYIQQPKTTEIEKEDDDSIKTQTDMDEIFFNSKSNHKYKELSNFYGNVEICYMQKRFANLKMKELFEDFKNCDNKKFIFYLKLLQPGKQIDTIAKERYWFNGDEPIRGILAKLVGSVIVKPNSFKKRIKAISKYLDISVDEVTKSDKVTTDEDMRECLMKKYSNEKYKQLLLSTGNSILHEKPLRGKPNAWTYDGEGGDKLGIMMMEIRNKLRNVPDIDMTSVISYNPITKVDSLNEQGYIVIKLPWMTMNKIEQIQLDFDNTLKEFREFKEGANDYIMGGFAALGNPSSFHNQLVRRLRMNAMADLIPLFKEYISRLDDSTSWKLEQNIDRMMYRLKGRTPSAESFHRDEAVNAEDNDKIFGGWINLDKTDQYFSCVPRTHTEVQGHAGFAPIKDKEDIEKYKKMTKKIKIPPGSIMIFYENLVHEVLGNKAKQTMYRLFTGWRITQSNESLIGNDKLKELLTSNSIIPLKSGQQPPMYAKLHWTNWLKKLIPFTENNILDEFTENRLRKSDNTEYKVVQKYMKSLKEMNKPLYEAYDENEINMYIPSRNWVLQYGGNNISYNYNF